MNYFSLKRRKYNINIKLYLIVALALFLVVGMGIGYSYIRKELNVNGKLELYSGSESKTLGILGTNKKAYLDNEPSPYVSSLTSIDFSKPSSDTNGKGLYILHDTQNSEHPIYYYRGEVNDNNVIFAGFCWKIVRTTDTGGVKLIYNGIAPANNTCTVDKGTSTQIGTDSFNSYNRLPLYTYFYNSVETDSIIKKAVDKWYADFMTDYTERLEDTIWCNDETYGANGRIKVNKTPNVMSCPQKDGSYTVTESTYGNGKLTYPVALITADEAAIAGLVHVTPIDGIKVSEMDKMQALGNYLNTDEVYWTLSPINDLFVLFVSFDGTLGYSSNVSYTGYLGTDYLVYCKNDYTSSTYCFNKNPSYDRDAIKTVFSTSSGFYGIVSNYNDTGGSHKRADYDGGVRPSVSLKPGTKASGGDGTAANPYIID